VLAGAAVAALTVYIISEPATAQAADHPAATRAAAVLTDQSQPPAVGRIMPVDDFVTDDDDSAQQQQQMLQDELQADQQMQQEAEEQNEMAQQEAQQAEQQGLLTEQEANLQVP